MIEIAMRQAFGARITFICATFPPEPTPSGVMAHQLAIRLAQDGHDVTMVVPFPNRPEGSIYSGFRRRLRTRETTKDGYTLVRCASWFIGRSRGHIHRILENVTFGLASTWATWREGRPDLIIAETWPILALQPVASLAKWWRVPFLNYVKDVYPEAAEEAGILGKSGILAKALRSWDSNLCKKSASVIVISETMRDLLSANRKLASDRFSVIPDWIDESKFPIWRADGAWRRSEKIGERDFVAMFAGTIGQVSGAEILIDVAKILAHIEDVLILCIGEGIRKQPMIDEARRLCLSNMRFLPFQPAERVPEVQSSSDVAILTMAPNSSDASVPSKLISYLAAARPVIVAANAHSAVARTVQLAEAGIVVPPGDAHGLANCILHLKRNSEDAKRMGRNARRWFEEHYTLERAYLQFTDLINMTLTNERDGSQQRQSGFSKGYESQ
jgi:colanic acid biosynthesis glycosyl transferase WcaI